jgi:hypothetical protein
MPVRTQHDRAANKDWKRLRSEHFVAVGNAAYVPMRSVLIELEGFRRALLRTSPGLRADSPVPTTVVVFKDEASFSKFKPRDPEGRRRESVAAYFIGGRDANYLVVAAHRDPSRTFHYLFHEYTHFIVRQNVRDVPEWLNEGLAEFYSTFRATPRDGRAVLGDPPLNRLPMLNRAGRLPLRDVLTMGREERAKASAERQQMFYSQSWALVHFLNLGDAGRHRPGIAAYLAALDRGVPVDAAVASAFGMTLDALQNAAARYAQRSTFPSQVIEESRDSAPIRTSLEALTPDEAASFQAALLALVHGDGPRIQGHGFTGHGFHGCSRVDVQATDYTDVHGSAL